MWFSFALEVLELDKAGAGWRSRFVESAYPAAVASSETGIAASTRSITSATDLGSTVVLVSANQENI